MLNKTRHRFSDLCRAAGIYGKMHAYLNDMLLHCRESGVELYPHTGEKMMHCWLAMDMTPEGNAAGQAVFDMINRV